MNRSPNHPALSTFLLVLLLGAFLALPLTAGDQPNVIVVMTDDQGYPELSAHGNPVLETPNLDAIHGESVRFTDFHVAPMCTPTRGQLLTGLDAARNGAINVSSGRTLLRPELPTMADYFREAGYRTGIFGKWHLGDNYPFRPRDRGFEEALWFPSSHINSTPDAWNNDYFDDTYRRNGERVDHEGYCTDVFFREATAWIGERAEEDEPFFAYIPTNAPHWPHWAPESCRAEVDDAFAAAEAEGAVPELPKGRRDVLVSYLAMIRNIDDNVGRLDEFLAESGLKEDTVLVFLTDNGSTFGHAYFPAGMRGKKTQLWEGGHRVPCFVRWPGGGLGAGRDVAGLTQVQDLLPTLLDLCGIDAGDAGDAGDATFDGVSLVPSLEGENGPPSDRMLVINYSRMPNGFEFPAPDAPSLMRRDGAGVLWKRWRLLRGSELYDLESDPLQKKNVIEDHPEVAKKMRAHLDEWWADVRDVANEPQRVVIGHEAENPMMLTACEWLDVFIDQQRQVRRADRKNGWWELEVAEAGEYEFELRRWPRDADLPLDAGAPAREVTDGALVEGEALDVATARMQVGDGPVRRRKVGPEAKAATFTVQLEAGPTRLYTWFDDSHRQAVVGAYYVYVRRTGEAD